MRSGRVAFAKGHTGNQQYAHKFEVLDSRHDINKFTSKLQHHTQLTGGIGMMVWGERELPNATTTRDDGMHRYMRVMGERQDRQRSLPGAACFCNVL